MSKKIYFITGVASEVTPVYVKADNAAMAIAAAEQAELEVVNNPFEITLMDQLEDIVPHFELEESKDGGEPKKTYKEASTYCMTLSDNHDVVFAVDGVDDIKKYALNPAVTHIGQYTEKAYLIEA